MAILAMKFAQKSFNGKSKARKSASWRQHGSSQKGRSLIAVFIAIILVFATVNGLLKSASIKNFFGDLGWDNNSSFAVFLATSPPSVFIYQNDPKRMVFLTLSKDAHFATGSFDEPLVKIGDLVESGDGEEMARVATINFGTDIEKYVTFKSILRIDHSAAEKLFKDFASITTPITVLRGNDSVVTNITRGEQISLWWQLKGLSVDRVNLVDLSTFSEEVVLSNNQKVLGVDEQALNRKVKEFLENRKVIEADFNVTVENASGLGLAGDLAGDLISSVGFDVSDITGAKNTNARTIVLSSDKNSYGAKLLARMFDCDILGAQREGIAVVVGQDFALRYFK